MISTLCKVYSQFLPVCLQVVVFDTGSIKHAFASLGGITVPVFVGKIYNFLDSALDDSFRAFIAGKESNIKGRAFEGSGIVGIEDGIEFSMADIGVFGFAPVPGACPRKIVIAAA